MRKKCKTKILKRVGALRGGWREDCEKICEIKWVGALRGRQRVDCEKMCEIKRDGWRVDYGGWGITAEGGLRKNVRN